MAEQFRKSGFFGPISWYRNSTCTGATDLLELNREHGSKKFEMPAMFLYGGNPYGGPPRAERKKAKEAAAAGTYVPPWRDDMLKWFTDMRVFEEVPNCGHWIPLEQPEF